MANSEIFNNFIKIAQEQGLISDSKRSEKLEETGRAGSDSVADIEKLYGVKCESDKDLKYKNNIMEVAHKEPVVIAPSYDKLNGLVENNIERQNIMLHIVNKPTNGFLINQKYAKMELTKALVRIGNAMDNKDEKDLCKLADYCLNRISKPLKKNAAAHLLPIAAVVAVLGGIYLKQHTKFISDGLKKDHEKLIDEIDDLLTSNTNLGVGYQYNQKFLTSLSQFRAKLQSFAQTFDKALKAIDDLEKPRDAKELIEEANKPETSELTNTFNEFKDGVEHILPEIQAILRNFSNEEYKKRQIEDKGFLSSLVDKVQFLHGGNALVADDFDDVKHALETYYGDIKEVSKELSSVNSFKEKAKAELTKAQANGQKMFGAKKEQTEDEVKPTETKRDYEKEAEEFEKRMKAGLI